MGLGRRHSMPDPLSPYEKISILKSEFFAHGMSGVCGNRAGSVPLHKGSRTLGWACCPPRAFPEFHLSFHYCKIFTLHSASWRIGISRIKMSPLWKAGIQENSIISSTKWPSLRPQLVTVSNWPSGICWRPFIGRQIGWTLAAKWIGSSNSTIAQSWPFTQPLAINSFPSYAIKTSSCKFVINENCPNL